MYHMILSSLRWTFATNTISSKRSHPVFVSDATWQSTSNTGALPHRTPDKRYTNGTMKIGERQSSGRSWPHCPFEPHDPIFVSCVWFVYLSPSLLNPGYGLNYTKWPIGLDIPTQKATFSFMIQMPRLGSHRPNRPKAGDALAFKLGQSMGRVNTKSTDGVHMRKIKSIVDWSWAPETKRKGSLMWRTIGIRNHQNMPKFFSILTPSLTRKTLNDIWCLIDYENIVLNLNDIS